MIKGQSAALAAAIAALCVGGTAAARDTFTPQDLAAGYTTLRDVDQSLNSQVDLLSGYARKYTNQLRAYATLTSPGNESVPCASGGSVSIHATGDLLQTLTARYSDCATDESGLQTVANGTVQLVQLHLSGSTNPKFVSLSFGTQQQAFVELIQFNPPHEPVLPPTQESLHYLVAGDVLESTDGVVNPGTFNYVVDGTFSDESTVLIGAPGNPTMLSTNVIDAHALWLSGYLRTATDTDPVERTALQANLGSITANHFEQQDQTSRFTSRQLSFNGLQIVRSNDQAFGNISLGYTGGFSVSSTNVPCQNGSYRVATPNLLTAQSVDAPFDSGTVQINRGTIQFSSSPDSGPGFATLRVPGYPIAQTDDLASFGNCVP